MVNAESLYRKVITKLTLLEKHNDDRYRPIYELMLFEYPNKELIYPTDKRSGFPDLGATMTAGYYHDLSDAIESMHVNNCDIRECVYNAGFILCRFPGMYQSVDKNWRIYFVWNEELQGFYEAEEPVVFKHIAY